MAKENEESFTVNINGSKTGTNYAGKFRARVWLSFGEELARDNLRRSLLGPATGTPAPGVVNVADVLSDLGIRIIEGPSWWQESNGGANILDSEVISELWDKCMDIPTKAMEALKEKAAAAKTNLASIDPNVVK